MSKNGFFLLNSFLNRFSESGERFFFFFSTNKAILELKNKKWTLKSTIFAKVATHVLTILGTKKSIFGLFQSCLRVAQELLGALFLDLKGSLLGVFSAQKVEK